MPKTIFCTLTSAITLIDLDYQNLPINNPKGHIVVTNAYEKSE